MSTASPLPGVIRDKLLAMDRQRRELAAVSGVGIFLCLASAAVGLCLLADAYGNLSPTWRGGFLIGLSAVLLGGIWWFVIRPLWRRRSWAELAAAVERDHPELKERLTTLIELRSDSEFGRVSSPLMREMLAKQTVKAVSNVDFTQALPAGRSLQRGALGLAALAVLLMPFLLPGGRYSLAWSRLLAPWGNYAWGSRLGFEVLDGDRVVARGSDVTLQAKLLGVQPSPETPLAASLEAVDERGVKHRREMMTWNADQEAYEITLPRVEQTFRYRVTSRQAESREYHITAANRPQITAWHIDVQPPAYTGLPAQSLDALGEELTVPEHSRLKLRWQFAEPVAIGSISWPESIVEPTPVADDDKSPQQKTRNNEQDLRFSDDRRSATAELSADVGGSFTVQLTSDLGLDSDEPARGLLVIPDQPPEIEIPRDEIVASVRPEDMLSIPMLAQDDYGLTAVEVHWKTSAGVTGSRGLPPEELIDRRIERTWKLDLSDLHLSSGQAVTCRLRAVDNRPVPSLQETWSEPIVVSVSNDAKSAEALELAAAQQSLENELKRLQDAVAEQQDAVDREHRETAREAVKGKERLEENREDLQQLRERQGALRDQLERLRAELQQRPLMEKAAGERLPEIERQLAAAEKSLNQAAEASEARDQIEQLSESLDELAKAESELEKLAQESKALAALEQELAELSRLSRLADKLADEAERLQRQANSQAPAESAENGGDARTAKNSEGAEQGDVADDDSKEASQDVDAPPTEEELERLRKETEQLTAKLDDLLRRRPELLDAARQNELQRLERLAEAAERLAEPQAQLAEAMSREAANSPQQASEPKSAAAANDNTQNPSQTSPPTESDNQNPQNAGEPASDQPASADQPAQANQPAASQPANQPTSANQPANSPKSTPSEPAAESRTAEANPPTPSTPNAKAQQKSDAATALEQQIAEAIRQQQQLAREAAELQQASQANAANSPENSNSKPPVSEPAQPQSPESKTGQKSGEQSASESKSSPPEEQPLDKFAKLSQEAAKSAQAGDLEQAAKQSQSACQACQNAAKTGNSPSNAKPGSSSPDGKSGSPSAQKAGQLAERQEALANEFQRLAQSSEARQQAQQQAQRRLSQAAQSLAKALEQSSQELSQQPLNEQKAGQCASGACQSAKSAGNAMSAASQALAGGKPSEAGQAAKSAGDQLEQAASHARQAAANSPPASPQASQIPGQTAGQVARAANQLQQAQSNLAQAEPPPAANSSQAGQSPSRGQSPGESGDKESSPSPGGKPSSQNGSRSNQPGEQPGSESTPNSNSAPGQPNAAVASQEEGQPSPLEQSADNLRQAARALAAACQSCRNPGSGKPGSNGKSNSPGNPGSASRNGDPIANQPDEPGDATQSPEGFLAFGNGSADPISELDPLDATAKPAAGMRNWGRLPKHLESEIVQGQAKKSHPEYSRQIKRYFEKIATPDAKR